MSAYSVSCECGASHRVAASQAGSKLACACGRSVAVPTMSALRKAAGELALVSTVDQIRAMVRDGELPTGDLCPYSGRPANDTIQFHVECERAWVRGGETSTREALVWTLLLGWIGLLFSYIKSSPREELGRDLVVVAPVKISADARSKIVRLRQQRTLKSLLSQTPIYARLLEEYPSATITVSDAR
jgi:hypothetical protein